MTRIKNWLMLFLAALINMVLTMVNGEGSSTQTTQDDISEISKSSRFSPDEGKHSMGITIATTVTAQSF